MFKNSIRKTGMLVCAISTLVCGLNASAIADTTAVLKDASIAAKPESLSTGPLNLKCDIKDFNSNEGFKNNATKFSYRIPLKNVGMGFMGVLEKAIAKYDVNEIISSDGKTLILHQWIDKAKGKKLDVTYVYEGNAFYTEVLIPNGTVITRPMAMQGACILVDDINEASRT